MTEFKRCGWCGTDPIYVVYHDTEWGRPVQDPRALWEMLVLEGFQAGLSWITILKRRENFRHSFQGFDPWRIASWKEDDIARLRMDAGIIRHEGKIRAAITSARLWCDIEQAQGFAPFLWDFVDHVPIQNHWQRSEDIPAATAQSTAMAAALKARGFSFCGPVICHAFMQAVGMVNDHLINCPAHAECAKLATPPLAAGA